MMNAEWLREADEEGLTPLDRAFKCGHRAIGEILLHQDKKDPGADQDETSPLHRAARLGLTGAVKALLTYGGEANVEDEHGETPLHKAVRGGHYKVVEALLDASDVNAESNEGMTPLQWASLRGDVEIAKLLIGHGADPYMRNEVLDGLTAEQMAAVMGHEAMNEIYAPRETWF